MSWLDPLRLALDRARAPVTFFLRDDDGGWGDERLLALLELPAERALPLDVAVIPAALRPRLAERLLARMADGAVGVHQHGLAHVDHERAGRRCEFGPARDRQAQRRDIAAGSALLAELLGPRVDPIFTPPWNRCTPDTGACLAELGFVALSREARAEPLGTPDLRELPITVDWFARRRGERLAPAAVGRLLGDAAQRPQPVGIMFHHAVMDAAERQRAAGLLDLLAGHPLARMRPMRALVGA